MSISPSPNRATPPAVLFARHGKVSTPGEPLRVLCARTHGEVVPVLAEIEREAAAGRFAAGFVSYEAAPAFDAALATHPASGFPLAWFAVYAHSPEPVTAHLGSPEGQHDLVWRAETSEGEYRAAVASIRRFIETGDTYQVNYTFPMRASFHGDARTLFRTLTAAQPTDYGCCIDTHEFAVLSVSPELFFRLDGETIECRPMKGTAQRGLASADDEARGAALRASPKERAENVMIVDMVRNDLGRIADTGSVRVHSLFDVGGIL